MFSSIGQYLFPKAIPESEWNFEKASDIHKKDRICRIIKAVSYAFMALAIITGVVLFEVTAFYIAPIVCLAIAAVAFGALSLKLHLSQKKFKRNLTDSKRAELGKEEMKRLLFKAPVNSFSSMAHIKSGFERINRMLEITIFSKDYLGQLDQLTFDEKSELSLCETINSYNLALPPETRPIKLELDKEEKLYKSTWFGPGTLERYASLKWENKINPENSKSSEDDIVFIFASSTSCKNKKYAHLYYQPKK